MSGVAYRSLLGEADRWLEQAVDTYRGGGGVQSAAAEAAIATAYYARAALEKPDTFASLMSAAQAAQAAKAAPPGVTLTDDNPDLEAAVSRHPSGKRRTADRGNDVEQHAP